RSRGRTADGYGWGSACGANSTQILLRGALDPLAELLIRGALLLELGDHAGDVLPDLIGDDLVALELATEVGVQVHRTAEVDLETLHAVAVGVGDGLALEADVGDLGAGTGVRAAVQRDLDGHVEVADAFLQLVDKLDGPRLGGGV